MMTTNATRISLMAVVIQIVVGLRLTIEALPACDRSMQCRRGPLRYGMARALNSQIPNGLRARRKNQASMSFLLANNNASNNPGGLPPVTGWLTRKKFLIAAVFLIVPPILLEAYSRVGAFAIGSPEGVKEGDTSKVLGNESYSFLPPPQNMEWDNVEHATIVFHGAGGQDSYTDELMKRLETDARPSSKSCYSHIVDWGEYSTNILQASYNGQRIGKLVARELLARSKTSNTNLKTIHFIGISVGAFCADAAVDEVKRNLEGGTDAAPFVQLTLLDPFQQRGIFGVGYGNRVFGKSADYAEQFLNTDDPVPSTNKPLKNTVCYDVTNLRPETIFGHDWPLVYYARSDRCGKLAIEYQGNDGSRLTQTGSVIVLSS